MQVFDWKVFCKQDFVVMNAIDLVYSESKSLFLLCDNHWGLHVIALSCGKCAKIFKNKKSRKQTKKWGGGGGGGNGKKPR